MVEKSVYMLEEVIFLKVMQLNCHVDFRDYFDMDGDRALNCGYGTDIYPLFPSNDITFETLIICSEEE